MADELVCRVTDQERADAAPVCVDLVLDAEALLGSGGGTAEVSAPGAGQAGPIPAGVAARILQAAPETGRRLRRLFVRPTAGQLVSADSRQRCFPAGAAHLVSLVHPTCNTPFCDAPAVHTDHVVDASGGGSTALSNAQGLCERCNLTKSLPGWRASPVGGSIGPPVAVVTATPTGHTYSSSAGSGDGAG